METYRVRWKPLAPLETPLQSDTIFGHLCWALRYASGEDRLRTLLENLIQGNGVFRCSSAFPLDYLPLPAALPVSAGKLESLKEFFEDDMTPAELDHPKLLDVRFTRFRKKLKKAVWIHRRLWERYREEFDLVEVFRTVLENLDNVDDRQGLFFSQGHLKDQDFSFSENNDWEQPSGKSGKWSRQIVVTHNNINRLTGTTGYDGNLYDERVTFFDDQAEYHSWIQTDLATEDEVRAMLSGIESGGFGRNKHTGHGAFQLALEPDRFPPVSDPNGWLVLSNMVPAQDDPLDAWWKGITKYGKTGGGYASSDAPYKYPFHVFTPGSVFRGSQQPRGTVVTQIHPTRDEIVQNLSCLSIPFKLAGGV